MVNYICPRCHRVFSRNSILQNHLRRKNQCEIIQNVNDNDYNDQPTQAPHNQHKQTQNCVCAPENYRKTPVKLPIYPENYRLSRKITDLPGKLPTFPENYRITEKLPVEQFSNDINNIISCEFCFQVFSHKNSLYRHKKHYCQKNQEKVTNPDLSSEIMALKQRIKELEKTQTTHTNDLVGLKDQPRINQNVLQVVCVGNNDNYLDMLTERLGNFDQALQYVKYCALSSLTGDCKLLKKIYFQGNNIDEEFPIKYLDKSRHKITYLDENKKRIIDVKGLLLGKKLANNLQNSYLKGVNYLIKQNLDKQECPNKFLEEYDLQSWNQHIYELSDPKYQRKLINQLDIPNSNNP